jgi:DNA excision repair protein ERCC-8
VGPTEISALPRTFNADDHPTLISPSHTPRLVAVNIHSWEIYRCMNELLFDRSTGRLGPQDFARLHASQLVERIQLAPKLRFDGGEKEYPAPHDGLESAGFLKSEPKQWAHQAGVSALDIDIDATILVSGGADSSIKIWSLDNIPNGGDRTLEPTATVSR